jgi:hypothetical protein
MAPPDGLFKDDQGRVLREGEFAYAEAYGRAVGKLAEQALGNAQPIELIPLNVRSAAVAVPIENSLYRAARLMGVIRRRAVAWTGDFHQADQAAIIRPQPAVAAQSEVACLRLGELHVACIPGELYPELVYGKFQEPVEPNVDFPDAPLEPTIQQLMPSDKWLVIGLANDELGYIVPKRQWDQQPPFAYDRKKAQYGEVNSCSPLAAPIIMQALRERVEELQRKASSDATLP